MALPALSRSFISAFNQDKVNVTFDFAFGEFVAENDFQTLMSDIQTQLINNDLTVVLPQYGKLDLSNIGDTMALNIAMSAYQDRREATRTMSRLGQSNERKLWTNLQN